MFPRISHFDYTGGDQLIRRTTIRNCAELLNKKYALIHGEDKSGKTVIARHAFGYLIDENKPVILIDLGDSAINTNRRSLFRDAYRSQFHGDYTLWCQRQEKTLILENMTSMPRLLDLLDRAQKEFDKIIVTTSSDTFYAFFKDEPRLADFEELKLETFTLQQQEQLIRKRMKVSILEGELSDGMVDHVERRVNSIVVSDRIFPRYPFYILSILQSFEAYMPTNISITSYGHCYYVLIVASLIRAGIRASDDSVNACFNFAEHLAFARYRWQESEEKEAFDFEDFQAQYRVQFIIDVSLVNRLKHSSFGIIDDFGKFRSLYMYYFFLGRYIAQEYEVRDEIVDSMAEAAHIEKNYLTLMFTIHHTHGTSIVDRICAKTMGVVEHLPAATLDAEETRGFLDILAEIPESILSDDSVESQRSSDKDSQRKAMEAEMEVQAEMERRRSADAGSVIYRVLKNNRVLGQILRSRHGNLRRDKVEQIISTVADSGLRLVRVILDDDWQMAWLALYIQGKRPEWDMKRIRRALEYMSLTWTLVNIQQVVNALNAPEIKESVAAVVNDANSPAYGLIGFFSLLESGEALTHVERDELRRLLRTYDYEFVRRVLSIRIQYYMNTHRSDRSIEQSMCDLLGIVYRPRALEEN